MTCSLFLKVNSAVIALLMIVGKGVKASDVVASVRAGGKITTFCDGQTLGLNLQTAVQEVEIFLNNTQIYMIKPDGTENRAPAVKSWNFNTTWLPDSNTRTNFNLTITIPSANKAYQGRLECKTVGINKKLIKYIFVYDDGKELVCPPNWYIYPVDRCVSLIPQPKSWTKANSFCSAKHQGHLVVIPDKAFEDYLMSVFKNHQGSVWVGLSDKEEESNFVWIGGKQAKYTNWQSSPQTDTSKNCVEKTFQVTGSWNVEDCNKTMPFICETKATNVSGLKKLLIIAGAVAGGLILLILCALCCPRCSKKPAAQAAESESKPADKSSDRPTESELEDEDLEDDDDMLDDDDDESFDD